MKNKYYNKLLIIIGIIIAVFILGIIIKGQFMKPQEVFTYEYYEGSPDARIMEIKKIKGIRYEIFPYIYSIVSEGSPDWGIMVYLEGDFNWIYFYVSHSPGGIDPFQREDVELERIEINEDVLVYAERDGHIDGRYSISGSNIPNYSGIELSMDKEVWVKNKKKIISLIESANVHK